MSHACFQVEHSRYGRDRWRDFDDVYRWEAYDTCDEINIDYEKSYLAVLRSALQNSPFVDMDPEIRAGKPIIGGTRIPVSMVLNAILSHGSVLDARKAYKQLTREQIEDALRFAVAVLGSSVEYEPANSRR